MLKNGLFIKIVVYQVVHKHDRSNFKKREMSNYRMGSRNLFSVLNNRINNNYPPSLARMRDIVFRPWANKVLSHHCVSL